VPVPFPFFLMSIGAPNAGFSRYPGEPQRPLYERRAR